MFIKKAALCKVAQSKTKITKKGKKSRNNKENLITKKKRAKEQRERITRYESPSPRPIKKKSERGDP